MSDVQVKFKRGNTSTLNSTAVTDGLIYFNTENKRIYLDNGDERLEYKNVMTNYMNKETLEALIDRDNIEEICPSYNKVNNIIGNSYIGEDNIIDTIDALLEDKALFELAWENNNIKSLTSTTIVLPKTYAFLVIFCHNYSSTSNSFYGDNYKVCVNNTDFYLQALSTNEIYNPYVTTSSSAVASDITNARKVTINNNQITIEQNGNYNEGELIYQHDDAYNLPYKIIGMINTTTT
jgi:hypothetical protein